METTDLYPVYCSWCQHQGRTTITNYSEIENSHGICTQCSTELLEQNQRDLEELAR